MAIAVPAVIKDARSRQRPRWIAFAALAAAVAVTATWLGGGFTGRSSPGPAAVVRGDTGWTLVSPSGFHRRTFAVTGFRWGARGVSIGNFSPLPTVASMDGPHGPLRVPAHGVLFQLYTQWVALESPNGKDPRLPLTLRDFPGFGQAPVSYSFTANGDSFVAVVGVGRDASQSDLKALRQTISSVRFRSPRPGALANGYYVLKRPSAYSVGTIVKVVPAVRTGLSPFYLIRDDSGFRAVGSQSACSIRFDRARMQFFCRGGGRWDSAGNVIANPPGVTQIEPLVTYKTITSQGHLLVTESVQFEAGCAPNLARRLPACPNYQPDSSSSRTS